ncbi:MAG: sigma-70 family RNA polymerase sigma factor [Gammaproteobacteria bacterium]|nr:sigma-70 family RNA polymerase sigma factor [Gammaproteobacteria bacterium]
MVQTDEALYTAYHEGDLSAFDCLYDRYKRPLYRFLLRRGLPQDAVEDVFHESWLSVISFEKKQHFKVGGFKAWIYTVSRNKSIDAFRKANIHTEENWDEHINEVFSEITTEQQQVDIDCLALMKESIAQLPFDQRDAFLLQQEAGLSLQQIAEMMKVGRETIKSRLRYAMNQLKTWLEECL